MWDDDVVDPIVAPDSNTPACDQGFSDEQLRAWRQAELTYGITDKQTQRKRDDVVVHPLSGSPGDAFRASDTFQGYLEGYVFKTVDQRTGYYIDAPNDVRDMHDDPMVDAFATSVSALLSMTLARRLLAIASLKIALGRTMDSGL